MDLPVHGLADWELDRLTAAEISCDEAITTLERHDFNAGTHPLLLGLRMVSRLCHDVLTRHDSAERRQARLVDVRQKMDRTFPSPHRGA